MTADRISLAFVNANVLTMARSQPRAEAVSIADGKIAAVGSSDEVGHLASGPAQVIDCQGLTLLPGFNDAHCHLPGLARRLQDLDCGPDRAPSIEALKAAVSRHSVGLSAESWVRGRGYDDLRMAERRHPTRHDLDDAVAGHPVWLEHRSGHASVLNTLALHRAGIHRETPDPAGGVIERDASTGEPTGVLYEMHGFLRERLGNIRTDREFEEGMQAVDDLLLGYGITSVQDAGADNGLDRWSTLGRLQESGVLSGRITMFAGIDRLGELKEAGLHFGTGDDWLRLGHAKIVLTLTSGALHPSRKDLKAMIVKAHGLGFPVAVHCIEEEAIVAAAEALAVGRELGLTDRIEHCAEGTPEVLEAVRRSGATVVTQPGFLYHNGQSYRENIDIRLLPSLYPVGALTEMGMPVAFGSDAPVIDPNPWPAIYSAVTRRAGDGNPISAGNQGGQRVSVGEALRMYTLAGAAAEGASGYKGAIAPGMAADLVLVDWDSTTSEGERLPEVRTVMTVIGGRVVWDKLQGPD